MRLYLITPSVWNQWHEDQLRSILSAMGSQVIAFLQWRVSGLALADEVASLRRVKTLCERASVALIVNDAPTHAVGQQGVIDGIHIGRSDGTILAARRQITRQHYLGVSCYNSLRRGLQAQTQGADYVAFGALFRTKTKTRVFPARLCLLKRWHKIGKVPSVAIGGIGLQHLAVLRRAQADYVAMISAIWQHPQGPLHAVRRFRLLSGCLRERGGWSGHGRRASTGGLNPKHSHNNEVEDAV